MAFPDHYCWLVLVGTLDILITYLILRLGGTEANPIARLSLDLLGHWGLILVKFPSLIVVVGICEWLAVRRATLGKRVADWSVAVSCFPVVYGLALIAVR